MVVFGKCCTTQTRSWREVGESHWNEVTELMNRILNMSTIKLRTFAPRMITSYLTPCSRKYWRMKELS